MKRRPPHRNPRTQPRSLHKHYCGTNQITRPDSDEPSFLEGSILTDLKKKRKKKKKKKKRERLLGSINGVSLEDFIDTSVSRTSQGRSNYEALLTPAELVHHVAPVFERRVIDEIQQLERKGCIAEWSQVPDTAKFPRPRNVWTGLWSGWCSSPYIYHSLSDAILNIFVPRAFPSSHGLMSFGLSNGTLPRARTSRSLDFAA